MSVKAVIFDWAGTTVDYGCFAPVGAFLETFRKRKIEPTLEEVRKPMGMLKKEHIRTMLEMERISDCWQEKYGRKYTKEDLDEMYRVYEKALFAVLPQYTDVKPYVLETVDALREKGIKIGSTTGYTDEMMAIVVKEAAKKGYQPDFWCSPDAVLDAGRPYPFMIFENMKALGIRSVNEVVKVGDTVSDILEGKNAGVYSVGVVEGSSELGLTMEEYENLSDEEREQQINRVTEIYRNAGAVAVILNMSELSGVVERCAFAR